MQIIVLIVHYLQDKDSGDLGLTAEDISEILYEADDATWPIEFYDIWGTTKNVRLLPLRAPVIKTEKGRPIEQYFELRMMEVQLA